MELFVLFYMIERAIDLDRQDSLILSFYLSSLSKNNHGIYSLYILHQIELCYLKLRFEITLMLLIIGLFIFCDCNSGGLMDRFS
jgi:hypothetical protein